MCLYIVTFFFTLNRLSKFLSFLGSPQVNRKHFNISSRKHFRQAMTKNLFVTQEKNRQPKVKYIGQKNLEKQVSPVV